MTDGWIEKIWPRLNVLWRGHWGAGTVEPSRFLHDHELVLVTKGSCVVDMEGHPIPLNSGDYLIIPPNLAHSTACRKSVFRSCFHFDWLPGHKNAGEQMWSYAPQRPAKGTFLETPGFIPKEVHRGSFPMSGPIPGMVETVFYRWQSGTQLGRTTAHASFLELIAHLFPDVPGATETDTQQSRFQMARAIKELLDANILSELGIQELLQTLGFSYAHLSRVFRGAFGITPVEYRNASRLEQAKILLRDTNLPLAEVGYRAGFQDAGYFSRQFRKQNQVGPGQFRIQIKA